MKWLVFVFVVLTPTLSLGSQSLVQRRPIPISVCAPMYLDGPQMCLKARDTTRLGNRIPILLIHGWNRTWSSPPSPEVWDNFVTYTATVPWVAEKYKFYYVDYYSNLKSVSDIGRILAELVDEMDALDSNFARQKIFLVGHSMGGLVARSFMQEWRLQAGRGVLGGERVLRLVTLATPHHGTPFANGPSRDDQARTSLGWIIKLVDSLLFQESPWSDYNRYDLHDDGYLDLSTNFDYKRFPQDFNLWLSHLNSANPYFAKMTAYAGMLASSDDLDVCGNLDLRCPAALMEQLYSLNSDGIVPIISGQARPCDKCVSVELFNDYDHYEMVQGLTPSDSYLFGAITSNLSDFVAATDNRFGSAVTLGDPASEVFHNLRGWAEAGRDSAGVIFRNQLDGQITFVDLFVPRTGVPYTLSFKRGGDTCGDEFELYVTIDDFDVVSWFLSSNELQCRVIQGNSFYQFQIPDYAVKKTKIRLVFYGWQSGSTARLVAPMYYVRLDP